MSNVSAQTIEEILLSQSLISQGQFDKLKQESIFTGKTPEEIILEKNLVTQDELVKAKSQLISMPYVDPSALDIKSDVLVLIPEATARKYNLVPFEKLQNILSVAMEDPEDLMIIQFIEKSTNLKVAPYIASHEKIVTSIEKEYSKTLGTAATQAIEQAAESSTQKLQETLKTIDEAGDIIKVSPVAKVVSIILEYAVKSGASDVHIEPFADNTRIRYRIDGELQQKFPLPSAIHNSIIARIKILANMPIDERRIPLDGKFKVEFGTTKTDLRVSTMPTIYGEKVVIRLLKDQQRDFTLRELGMWGKAHQDYKKSLYQTTGIIFVTGPTGSGKTVTQATSLSKINSIKVNIITLEDPVEISVHGVNQVQINTKAGLTFATGLRSILRQDPDIVMIGEVRDVETARLAIQASLTGHLVLATLHTNSAAGTIPRLKDMGIESYLIASTINVAVAQRLAKRLCSFCKEAYEPEESIVKTIKSVLNENLLKLGLGQSPFDDEPIGTAESANTKGTRTNEGESAHTNGTENETPKTDNMKLYKAKGCDKCGGTGYKGRIGLFEVMNVTETIRSLTMQNISAEEIEKTAIKEGMITLLQDGYLKALWGITTLEQTLTVVSE